MEVYYSRWVRLTQILSFAWKVSVYSLSLHHNRENILGTVITGDGIWTTGYDHKVFAVEVPNFSENEGQHDIVNSFLYEFYLHAQTLNNGTTVMCWCVWVMLFVVKGQNCICLLSGKSTITRYLSIQCKFCRVFLAIHDIS